MLMTTAFVLSLAMALAIAFFTARHISLHGERLGLLQVPNPRSSHKKPTPSGGGVGVALACTLSLAPWLWITAPALTWVVVISALGGVVGLLDDRLDVPAQYRIVIHFLLVGILSYGALGLPASPALMTLATWALALFLGAWWINLFNFMDGTDGIAASEAIFILSAAAFLLGFGDLDGLLLPLSVGIVASMGFLLLNWPPARIFMGDAGSNYLAFFILGLAFITLAAGSLSLAVWVILTATFVTDATITLLRRMLRGERWLAAHREHTYQRLSRRWNGHSQVTLLYAAINLLWLFPLALVAHHHPDRGWSTALMAYLPIVAANIFVQASWPDPVPLKSGDVWSLALPGKESNLAKRVTRLWHRVLPDPVTLKNLLWNAAGTGAPLLAALIAVPILLAHLGVERFGVLSLAWVIVGYFGFFDLGLGRAITQLVAQRIGTNQQGDIPAIVQTGQLAMTALGVLGGIVVAVLSPWIVRTQLAIPPELVEETLTAFFILAASIPIVIVTTGIRGVLEGYQRFDVVNIVRAPMGVLIYVGPLLALPFSQELPAVVGVLVIGRVVSLLAYAIACMRLFPQLLRFRSLDPSALPELLAFGGWMTLSNIAGPLLLYAGRIALIILVSAEAVAFFSTPYDVVISVLLIPGIFVGVLFPVFAERFRSNASAVRPAYRQAMLQNLVLLLPVTIIIVLLAEPAISLWINPEFSEQSFRVAQLLALGVFVNSFGYYSQALVQAYGRPDLTAKLHVAELAAYMPYMLWLVQNYGVNGAAAAWVIRVTISTIALALMAGACLNGTVSRPTRIKTYADF